MRQAAWPGLGRDRADEPLSPALRDARVRLDGTPCAGRPAVAFSGRTRRAELLFEDLSVSDRDRPEEGRCSQEGQRMIGVQGFRQDHDPLL